MLLKTVAQENNLLKQYHHDDWGCVVGCFRRDPSKIHSQSLVTTMLALPGESPRAFKIHYMYSRRIAKSCHNLRVHNHSNKLSTDIFLFVKPALCAGGRVYSVDEQIGTSKFDG